MFRLVISNKYHKMSVLLIHSLDGTNIAVELQRSLAPSVQKVTLANYSSYVSDAGSTHTITVIVLTSHLYRDIRANGFTKINSMLSRGPSVIMASSDGQDYAEFKKMFDLQLHDTKTVSLFDCSNVSGWFKGEALIKTILAEKMETRVATANRFIICPDSVSHGQGELHIILLQDESRVEHLEVTAEYENILPCKRLHGTVWSCDIRGLKPGPHTLVVRQGKWKLGSETVTIKSPLDDFRLTVARCVQDDPRKLFAILIGVDVRDLDAELADVLRNSTGSAFIKLAEGLLRAGEDELTGYTFPSLLHLCARFNLAKTARWLAEQDLLSTVHSLDHFDLTGMTPRDIAKKTGANDVIDIVEMLKETHEGKDDEDFQILRSPAHNSARNSSHDSGNFSSDSVQLHNHNFMTKRRKQSVRSSLSDCVGPSEYRTNVNRLPSDVETMRLSSLVMDPVYVAQRRAWFPPQRNHLYNEIEEPDTIQTVAQTDDLQRNIILPACSTQVQPCSGDRHMTHSQSEGQLTVYQTLEQRSSDPRHNADYATIRKSESYSTFL